MDGWICFLRCLYCPHNLQNIRLCRLRSTIWSLIPPLSFFCVNKKNNKILFQLTILRATVLILHFADDFFTWKRIKKENLSQKDAQTWKTKRVYKDCGPCVCGSKDEWEKELKKIKLNKCNKKLASLKPSAIFL